MSDDDAEQKHYPVSVGDKTIGYIAEGDDGAFNAMTLKLTIVSAYASMEAAQLAVASDWRASLTEEKRQ